ncbi:MAG: four helix bundle protein [Cytophagales bacterium]
MKSYSELEVYKQAYHLAVVIHDLTGLYDDEEEFESLVNELRAVSRAVVARISDAWTHRKFMSNIEIHLAKAVTEINMTIDLLKKAHDSDIISEKRFQEKVTEYLAIQHDLHEIMEKGSF